MAASFGLVRKRQADMGTLECISKTKRHHRVAWELARGPVPEGFFVCHVCDIPACVNPDHLFLGTNADNMRNCAAKGRTARGQKSGMHKLTEDQVREIRQRYSEGGVSQRTLAGAYGSVLALLTQSSIRTRGSMSHKAPLQQVAGLMKPG
jgi:HNH endonuclease